MERLKTKRFAKYYEGYNNSLQEASAYEYIGLVNEYAFYWPSRDSLKTYKKWKYEFEGNVLNYGRDKKALQDYLSVIYSNGLMRLKHYFCITRTSCLDTLFNNNIEKGLDNSEFMAMSNYADSLIQECSNIKSYIKLNTDFEIINGLEFKYDVEGNIIGDFDLITKTK